jgi:hypothetical protein
MTQPRTWFWGGLAASLAALAWAAAVRGAPSAAIPGYRLEATWPAAQHGLAMPRSLTTGPDGRVWVLDGSARSAVALAPDGTVSERRPVPADALDLAVDAAGDLFLGRHNENRGAAGRYGSGGAKRWDRDCRCGTGAGVALTTGRVWLTTPTAGVLTWLGAADGGVTGQLAGRGAADGFPSDVAAAPDGTLFATDPVGRALMAWAPPYLPGDVTRWPLLESNGPFRVAAGADSGGDTLAAVLLADGTVRVHRADGALVARFLVPGQPADLAIGQGARIYVLDDETGDIRVYTPGAPPTNTPPPPDPPLGRGSCTMTGSYELRPDVIDRCNTTTVRLSLDATCPPEAVVGADVAVVMDHSLSMNLGRGKKRIDYARAAAKQFVAGLDFRYHRAAVVTFADDATVAQPLTADRAAVLAALDPYRGQSGTNIEAGIRAAMDHLTRAGRPNALPVIVLLTDGAPTLPTVPESNMAALVAAERARSRRAYIVTIGLGDTIDSRLMAAIASSPDDFYYAPDPADLNRIYDTILRVIGRLGVTDLVIEDTPRSGFVQYVPGSGAPPPLVVNDTLTWNRPALPPGGLVFTYTLRAAGAPGRGPAGQARLRYVDADGTHRTFAVPRTDLSVRLPAGPPGPGPTVAPGTAEPSATPPPVTPAPCPPGAAAWSVGLQVFPDTVGAGGYSCPGCNGVYDAGDQWRSQGGPVGPVILSVADAAGRTLWRGAVAQSGSGPLRALIRLCSPPPYTVAMDALPAGYAACPNSPARRVLGAGAFGDGRHAEARFGLWTVCGPVAPVPTVPASATALPACP